MMSIRKRVRNSLLFVSITAVAILLLISLLGLFNIRSTFSKQMEIASDTISTNNTQDMLEMSVQLAESTALQNARRINGDFSRIKGELFTLKGDIENIYNGGGIRTQTIPVMRHSEYLVPHAATLSKEEIDQTVDVMAGVIPMFNNILVNENKISLAYVVLENGMVFSSSDTFYPAVEKTDMRTREWYKGAMAAGKIHWSDLYDGSDGRSYVTVSIPVYSDDEAFGVVAFDLRVSEISNVVLNDENAAFTSAFIMRHNGDLLLSTEDIAATTESDVYIGMKGHLGLSIKSSGCYQGDNIIAGYANIQETGWVLVNLMDYDQMLAPVTRVEHTVSTASDGMRATMTRQIYTIIVIFVLVFAILIATAVLASRKLAEQITRPLMELNDGVKVVSEGNLNCFIEIHTGDEIETLAHSFNKMTHDLLDQMINLKNVTAEKERIGTELGVATHIQASMLPCIFPAFPGRSEFDIYATMRPAKEVGGDFYDFFLVDDNHLAMVMADVSGKGVPAALFMVIAKTLIKNIAQTGMSPKDVLEKVNNQLCENNEAEMFVTVWLGILEISTGKVTCANAGHECPALKRAGKDYELVREKHGFVVAGMENVRYTEYSIALTPGDRLYLYTDGVPEATNANNELYGTDRMIDTLNHCKDAPCEDVLHYVKEDIDLFVGEAPQFDDITMLCLEMRGNP